MKKLTTVQVTPITQKGAVITPIQCEVKRGPSPSARCPVGMLSKWQVRIPTKS